MNGLNNGDLPFVILNILTDGNLHGYAIAKQVEKRSSGMLTMNEGSLYPALRILEQDGLVTSTWETQERGPARRNYSLTDKGRAKLVPMAEEFERGTAIRICFNRRPNDAQPA